MYCYIAHHNRIYIGGFCALYAEKNIESHRIIAALWYLISFSIVNIRS
jgi:hypothetical protein